MVTSIEGNEKNAEDVERGILVNLVEALANKQSQLDINFKNATIRIPGIQARCELNGLVTVTINLRELTDEEKQASSKRNVALMAAR